VFIKAPNTFIGHNQSRCARTTSSTCTTKLNWWW
jgi:hypothetical protein